MRVFITGGTGFVGSRVVKELQNEENALLLLSRQPKDVLSKMPNVDMVQGDLADIDRWKDKVAQFDPQVAIHLAWEDIPNYDVKTSVRNLKHGLNLLAMLAESGCQSVICSGSCWEYGQQSGELSEETAVKPHNAFSAAKNALHWLGREVAREHDMHFIWTRLFYVYGPGQRETSLIPYIISCVKNGKKPEIKIPGNRNDFVYVEDVARAIAAIVKKPQQDGVYNIGSGYSTSVHGIIKLIYNILDYPCEIGVLNNKNTDVAVDFWADISKIKREIGWKPQIEPEAGIQKVLAQLSSKGIKRV